MVEALDERTYEVAGILRWQANDHVVPPHVFETAGREVPQGQRDAERDEVAEFARQYRENQSAVASDEEMFEMRAAFGEGAEVVDVISGRIRT